MLAKNLTILSTTLTKITNVWEQERLGNVGDFKSSSVDKIIRKNDLSIFLLNFMDVYKGVKITSKNLSINTANKFSNKFI
ncbi:hypothetical protein NWP96_04810 [Mycoplasmopsis cynos]|nr:hypothetical protein [Mycoplasmopsis cynos]